MINLFNHYLGLLKIKLSRSYLESKKKLNHFAFFRLILIFFRKVSDFLNTTHHYSSLTQHRIILGDNIRTKAFYKAISRINLKDKVVLDAGCGTGIFGFFASQRGAKKIIAVDRSNFIDKAMMLAKKNKIENIDFIQQDLTKLYFPQKIDVLIHENIGNFIFDENTINVVTHLKEKLLKRNAKIIPYQIDWSIVPVMLKKIAIYPPQAFWSTNPYNLDFSNLLNYELDKPISILLKTKDVYLSKPAVIYNLNYNKRIIPPKKINHSFLINKDGSINGALGFFKVKLDEKNFISTEPSLKLTHWGQMLFPNIFPLVVKKNDIVNFSILLNNYLDPASWQHQFKLIKIDP